MTTSYNTTKKKRHRARTKDQFGKPKSTHRLFIIKKKGGDTNGNEPTTKSTVDNGLAKDFINRGSV